MRPWTILVYLAGDNNLDAAALRDLAEMKTVGSTADVAVVAQLDRLGEDGAFRYHLTAGSPESPDPVRRTTDALATGNAPFDNLRTDQVATLPEVNSGDPSTLLDFIRWGIATYPAQHIALVLWNHGAGWKDDDIYARARAAGMDARDVPPAAVRGPGLDAGHRSLFLPSVAQLRAAPASVRGILFDDTQKDFLDNKELKSVLATVQAERAGRKLDLLGCDACLMNMIETAYQVQAHCDYLVGSQEVEPTDGWPYAELLARLAAAPDMAPAGLARTIVETYADYQARHAALPGLWKTQSAVRLSQVPDLVSQVGRLADGLTAHLGDAAFHRDVLGPALRHVQRFHDQSYVDLGHYATLVADGIGHGELAETARQVSGMMDPGRPEAAILANKAVGGPGDDRPRSVGGAAELGREAGESTGFERVVGRPPESASGAGGPGDLDRMPAAPTLGGDAPADSRDVGAAQTALSSMPDGHISGLSIYWPSWPPVSPAYADLEFGRTPWAPFLAAYLAS